MINILPVLGCAEQADGSGQWREGDGSPQDAEDDGATHADSPTWTNIASDFIHVHSAFHQTQSCCPEESCSASCHAIPGSFTWIGLDRILKHVNKNAPTVGDFFGFF